MSCLSAWFFARVQAAPFYKALHEEAVALLPTGQGKLWLDMGCGPGLLSRLAWRRGYRVKGVDADPAMVRLAQRMATTLSGDHPAFEVGRLGDPMAATADVVSAASLLAVLSDRPAALRALLALLRPGGTLLLIEPSVLMNPEAVRRFLAEHRGLRDAWVLRLWARTRQPSRLVQAADLAVPGFTITQQPLLGGLVNAWMLHARAGGPHPVGAAR